MITSHLFYQQDSASARWCSLSTSTEKTNPSRHGSKTTWYTVMNTNLNDHYLLIGCLFPSLQWAPTSDHSGITNLICASDKYRINNLMWNIFIYYKDMVSIVIHLKGIWNIFCWCWHFQQDTEITLFTRAFKNILPEDFFYWAILKFFAWK